MQEPFDLWFFWMKRGLQKRQDTLFIGILNLYFGHTESVTSWYKNQHTQSTIQYFVNKAKNEPANVMHF